jgi:hypothetical protein
MKLVLSSSHQEMVWIGELINSFEFKSMASHIFAPKPFYG